jgi:hypothetical protein
MKEKEGKLVIVENFLFLGFYINEVQMLSIIKYIATIFY